MAQQAPFLSKTIFVLGLLFCGCKGAPVKAPSPGVLLNKEAQRKKIINGLLYVNDQIFTGTLYTLYPHTKDTLETASYWNGKEQGEWEKFYPNHRLKEKRYFDNGEKTGAYLSWWENGQKQTQCFFVADEYEGAYQEWNEQGRLTKLMHYKKGYEEGHQQWWYDNGKIKANYIIIDGRRYGLLGTKNCTNVSDSVFKK